MMLSARQFVVIVRSCALSVVAICALVSMGCGYQPPATPLLNPSSATIQVNAEQAFTVIQAPRAAVWTVNGIPGGNDIVGTITPDGIYTAPEAPPAASVTIGIASAQFPALGASATVAVVNPVPVLTSVEPTAVLIDSAPVLLTVNGRDFRRGSVVTLDGQDYSTDYISSTELRVALSAGVAQQSGSVAVAVRTAGPGGGKSASTSLPVVRPGDVEPTQHPLVARYRIFVPTAGNVSVDFGADSSYGRKTSSLSVPAGGGQVTALVAGMRAASTYHMRAVVQLANGDTLFDSDHLFITGPLPQIDFPVATVTRTPGAVMAGGVDLISALDSDAGAVVLDTDGQIVWYYYDPAFGSWAFPLKQLDNGDFLINSRNEIREVTLAGETVRSVVVSDLERKLSDAGYTDFFTDAHHDVAVLPNGHWVVLLLDYRDYTDLPGYPGTTTVTGDVLVDVDENNNPVWVWQAFDHLDVNRHPFNFPDWTHSNAVLYTPDGNLLLSMRHQSWIIKIDYENGKGSGDVLWRLGADGNFSLAGGNLADWFYSQHFPVLRPSSGSSMSLAVYDNGDARPDSSGQMCYLTNTCYSRVAIFDVDESMKTASVSWEYQPGWYSFWGGSVAFLENGDVEFDSSAPDGPSRIVEVTGGSAPQEVWRTDFNVGGIYRAYRVPSLYPGVQW